MDLKCLRVIKCDQGAVRAVRFNVDGSYCLTCGSDKKLKLWNPHKGLFLKTYGGHGDEVHDACGSSDSSQIISGGADKSVILWDVATGQPVRRFIGHAGRVSSVKFNEESSLAVSGSQDNTVMFWDCKARKNDPIQILRDAKDAITAVHINESEIITSSLDCQIRCYDIRTGKMTADFIGESITCVSLTRDGQCYVVSTADSTVRLFDKPSGELLAEFSGHKTEDLIIESCSNQKDNHILSGSADGFVYCWDLISQKIVNTWKHPNSRIVHSLSAHPTQNYYLTASGGNVFLWGEQDLIENEETED